MLQAVKRSRDFKPALVPCSDVEQQSVFVASRILELRDEGTSLEDIAVIYRSHYHSIELQLELSRRNIPYRVQSGVRFFEQAHIKDVISYLRIIVNPRDELAWKRILKMIPGVGNRTANKVYRIDRRCQSRKRNGRFRLRRSTARRRSRVATSQKTSALSDTAGSGRVARVSVAKLCKADRMLVNHENRGRPSKQIALILENGYEQYLQENYENADARMEDLQGLAQFANRYTID